MHCTYSGVSPVQCNLESFSRGAEANRMCIINVKMAEVSTLSDELY